LPGIPALHDASRRSASGPEVGSQEAEAASSEEIHLIRTFGSSAGARLPYMPFESSYAG